MTKVTMTINGKEVSGDVEGRTLLASFLREDLRMTGTHIGCDTSPMRGLCCARERQSGKILHHVRG